VSDLVSVSFLFYLTPFFIDGAGADPEKIEEGFTGWDQGNI